MDGRADLSSPLSLVWCLMGERQRLKAGGSAGQAENLVGVTSSNRSIDIDHQGASDALGSISNFIDRNTLNSLTQLARRPDQGPRTRRSAAREAALRHSSMAWSFVARWLSGQYRRPPSTLETKRPLRVAAQSARRAVARSSPPSATRPAVTSAARRRPRRSPNQTAIPVRL